MREAPQRTFYAQYHFSLSQINLYMYSCFKRLRTDIKSLHDEIQVISFLFLTFHVHPTIFLCIYLVLVALGLCCCMWAFSSYEGRGLLSSWVGTGFLLWWLLLLRSTGSRCMGFSSCNLLALGYLGFPSCGVGLISCGSWALECRLGSCDAWTSCSEACETSLDQ